MEIPQIKPDELVKKSFKEKLVSFVKKRKWVLVGVGVGLAVFMAAIIIPGLLVYKNARALTASARKLESVVKDEQNIIRVREEIGNVRSDLTSLQKSYKILGWTRILPLVGGYYRDGDAVMKAGQHGLDAAEIIITTVEPYADIIGFTGDPSKEAQSGEENANDRIEFIVATIDDVIPQLEEISQKVKLAQAEIDKVNPNRYPVKVAGREVRNKIKDGVAMVDQGASLVEDSIPLLRVAPYLMGIDGDREYLILFQNDKELRPTGGFLTAYSLADVSEGKFSPVASDDIYHLDGRYPPSVPAPDPVVKYIKGPYVLNKNVRLRDMNFSPDFAESMDLFVEAAEKAGIRDIDGVIAVDTQVLVNLLDVLGQIGVPGFGNFSTEIDPRCDCPQVIYELESFADQEGPVIWDPLTGEIILAPPNMDNRKKIVGPLMNSILSNALGQPKEKLPDLFEAAFKSLLEKHVLLYMLDDEAQAGVESFNIAGRIKEYGGDYLHVNDANLGGRKSNLYVNQEVVQNIEVAPDGSVTKTLTITYKNTKDYDGWLNSVLPNWTRIYVPRGSELIDSSGFEDKAQPYEDLGKTVFAGGFELRPNGVVQIEVVYKLPFGVDDEYKMLIQKQPGKDAPLYSIELGKQSEELFLRTDKEFRFRI
ncbi:hypothetical protein A2630_04425 [Candidatus Woesebacteria bacterium RIFCSPHIGHO2_01_FULL_44_10]|nr:MAG: hypothetical protein A2630_04425 [Candidatus Woesebacteria bacterium RIFCSPHIGHO2_01_FULL_44_10]